MHIVMGATGHVGGAVVRALLDRGEAVAILTREPVKADDWRDLGAQVIEADGEDTASLKAAFRQGRRAFLLNPPADPSTDTNKVERQTVANILEALDGSGLEKVVAASVIGARHGTGVGDLTTLCALEEGLRAQPIPAAINRGAYYMKNWTGLADMVRETGKLPSNFPADFVLPMVAGNDLGRVGAERMLSSIEDIGVRCVEGPERYTPQDVADVFAKAMGRKVSVDVTPREGLDASFREMGFSPEAARAYTRMTEATLDAEFPPLTEVERGEVTLEHFVMDAIGSVQAAQPLASLLIAQPPAIRYTARIPAGGASWRGLQSCFRAEAPRERSRWACSTR